MTSVRLVVFLASSLTFAVGTHREEMIRPVQAQSIPRRPRTHVIKAGTAIQGELGRPLCEDSFAIGDTITAKLHPARAILSRPRWWPKQFVVILRRRAPVVAKEGALLRLAVVRATVEGVDVHDVEGSFSIEVESGHKKIGDPDVNCHVGVNGQLTKTLRMR
jgi:hypothetical protein